MQNVRDNSVKMLSMLSGHADHIRDDRVLSIIRRDNEYHRKPGQIHMRHKNVKTFAFCDSENVTCGAW